jgi:hypothetical protein
MSPPAIDVVEPTGDRVEHVAAHLRAQDLAELAAAGWADPHVALRQSVQRSRWTRVALIDEVPAAVFGCGEFGSMLAPDGVPWLLGTEAVSRHGRVLQRYARAYIAAMLAEYPRLINAVHAENTVSLRWLRRLGFRVHAPVAVPPHGALFHTFEMTRDV